MRVGLIGTGSMGRNHARILSEMGVLSAICDAVPKTAKRASNLYRCTPYTKYEDMVKKEDLDAVIIAAPTSLHKDMAIYCMQEGLDVLVEKPIGNNLREAKEIIKTSNKEGRTLMVGHVERFNPVVIMAKNHVNPDTTSAGFRRLGLMPRTRDVDVIFDLCIHDVDVAAYLLGELKLINAVGIEKDGILEHVAAKFKAGRTLVDIESSRLSPVKIRKFYMLDKEKMLEGNYITQRIEIQKGVKAKGYPKTFGEFVLRGIQTTKESLNLIPEEPLKIELEHFIKCVQEHKEPMITNDDVLRAMELSEEIKASVVL